MSIQPNRTTRLVNIDKTLSQLAMALGVELDSGTLGEGENAKFIHVRVRDGDIIATKTLGRGIKARLTKKSGGATAVASYLFPKDRGWTPERAKKWAVNHGEKPTNVE